MRHKKGLIVAAENEHARKNMLKNAYFIIYCGKMCTFEFEFIMEGENGISQ